MEAIDDEVTKKYVEEWRDLWRKAVKWLNASLAVGAERRGVVRRLR